MHLERGGWPEKNIRVWFEKKGTFSKASWAIKRYIAILLYYRIVCWSWNVVIKDNYNWTIITVAFFFSYQTTIHRNGIPAAIDFRRNTVIEFRSQTQYSGGWQHGRRRSAAPRHVFFRFLRTLNFTIYIRHFTTHVNDHWSTHLFLLNKTTLKTDDSVEEKL